MDEILVPRPTYQSLLMRTVSSPMIKVLVGMRRTGKSSLMRLFIKDLLSSGIDPSRIYYRKFDDELAEERPDLRGMIDDVKSRIEVGRGSFVLLDEMQDIDGWERAVESFYEAGADVYITGSNATMLSSQLASGLSGRYVEIAVYPLTFAEFVEFRRSRGDASGEDALMGRFQQTGSLPAVALMDEDDTDLIEMMLSGIFSTVFVKDVVQRNEIRNSAKIYNLNRFMMRNIGDRVSVRSAAGYLTSTSSKTNPETVDSYIGMLEAAMLFYRAKRMDSETKDYLRTSEKFYCTDIGMRNALVPSRPEDVDGVMENIVFMELKKRYGTVCTYDVNGREVDFAVWTPRYKAYYQVCADITSPDTLKRELAPLRAIDDNYPKFVICKGRSMHDEVDGIRIVDYDGWVKEPYRRWTAGSRSNSWMAAVTAMAGNERKPTGNRDDGDRWACPGSHLIRPGIPPRRECRRLPMSIDLRCAHLGARHRAFEPDLERTPQSADILGGMMPGEGGVVPRLKRCQENRSWTGLWSSWVRRSRYRSPH